MILAGTGHRPDKLGGYDPHTTKRVLRFAERVLEVYEPTVVISGMAQGWDMALAQAALNLGIPFRAYIPFIGQEQVWPSATRLYYKALLAEAEETKFCSTGGYTKASMQIRNQCMVDDCDLVAALWNGSSGGTANCISYALFKGRPYVNLWPQFLNGDIHENEAIPLVVQADGLDDGHLPLCSGPDWLSIRDQDPPR